MVDCLVQALIDGRQQKMSRTMDSNATIDVYDEHLTRLEIQELLDGVHHFAAVESVLMAVETGDKHRLLNSLTNPVLGFFFFFLLLLFLS